MINFEHLITVDILIQTYLIFKALDFITGFLKAYKIEGWRSSKIREGVVFVIAEIIAIIFAGVLDQVLGLNILLLATKCLFIYKEAISIVENLGILGIDLPPVIKNQIELFKNKSDSEGGNKNE